MATITLQPRASAEHRPSFAVLAKQLKALGDPTRLAIVTLLARREHCVCDLVTVLALPQSTCSHHLSILRRAGLVRDRRGTDARWAYYSLAPEAVGMLRAQFSTVLNLDSFDPTPADCD